MTPEQQPIEPLTRPLTLPLLVGEKYLTRNGLKAQVEPEITVHRAAALMSLGTILATLWLGGWAQTAAILACYWAPMLMTGLWNWRPQHDA